MTLWSIVGYALFGLVAGALARLVHPGKDPMNWFWTMALGIAGAELGGFGARQMGYEPNNGATSWVAAIVGSLILLVVYHALTARNAPGTMSTVGPASNDDYKEAVFNDLSRGPNG